ncbi:MAG: hypothetical protein AAGD01_03260 [Acidobacteriota bacterium]
MSFSQTLSLSFSPLTPNVGPRTLVATLGALLVVLGCLLPSPADATTYRWIDDGDLADATDLIAEIQVVSSALAPPEGRYPATDYIVDVERVLQGQAEGSRLILRLPGGPAPGTGLRLEVAGVPELEDGERLLAMLERLQPGVYRLHGMMLGAFYPVKRNGQELAIRDLSQAVETPAPGEANGLLAGHSSHASTRGPIARDWERFTQWLSDRANGERRGADYRVELPEPDLGALVDAFTITRRGGRPSRVFEFDTGQAVPWFTSRERQPGLAGGGIAQIQSAMARWNRVSNSNINLRYDGETSNFNVVEFFDETNVVYYDDPNNDVTGTCRSGGVLAAAFSWAADEIFLPYNGRDYTRIFGADIITNDGGALCGYDDPTFFEIVMTHEFGHTLGFGHSCDEEAGTAPPTCLSDPLLNDAIMRATVQNVFRGPELGVDDIAAARFLYNPNVSIPTAPAAPSDLAVELDLLDATLTWIDNSTNEDGFRIERSIGDGPSELLAEVAANVVSFFDPGLLPDTQYNYRLQSFRGGQRSASVLLSLRTPPLTPVEIVEVTTPSGPDPRVIRLQVEIEGPVERLEWETTDGEVGFADQPCAPSAYCFDRFALADLSFGVTLTLVGDLGQESSVARSVNFSNNGPDPEVSTLESLVQSTIFGRRGDTGTFQSHLWLHNASDRWANTEIQYLPRGLSNRNPEARTVSIAPGRTLFLGNILASLFNEEGGSGSLGLISRGAAVEGQPDIRAISRSFVELNDAQGGSFGQFVGEDQAIDFSANEKLVTGIFESTDFITTLLAASLGDSPTSVEMTLVDSAGAAVDDPAIFNLGVRTMRFQRLRVLFPSVLQRSGPFTARFRSLDGTAFAASATLLEADSEDQIFLPARDLGSLDANPLYLPRVLRDFGLFDSELVSRLVAHNPSTADTVLTLDLLLRGQDNSTPQSAQLTVPAGQTVAVNNLMQELFELEEATGALRVGWQNARGEAPRVLSLAFASTETDGVTRRFGMLVDSRDPAEGAQQIVDFGAEQSSIFKASYGVVNLADRLTRIEVVLRDSNGNVIATKRRGLQPFQHLELNLVGLFSPENIGEGSSWSLTTEVVLGGDVLTYLANINTSGDVFFIPGRSTAP